MHRADQQLKRVKPPVARDECLEVYICGKHKPVPEGYWIHAFAAEYVRSSGQHHSFSRYVSDRSAECKNTNSSRAILGALLTAMHWLEINEAEANKVVIYSDEEYVTKWLSERIEKWCTQHPGKRPNRDLLDRLLPYFKPGAWPNKSVVYPRAKDFGLITTNGLQIGTGIPSHPKDRLARLKEVVSEQLNRHIENRAYEDDLDILNFLHTSWKEPMMSSVRASTRYSNGCYPEIRRRWG